MPAEVLEGPLRLSCKFTTGSSAVLEVGESPNPALTRELVEGLVDMVAPHGPWDAQNTVNRGLAAIRRFVRQLDRLGFSGSAAELTRAKLAECWFGSTHRAETGVRKILVAVDDATGVLRPDVRALVEGRAFNPAVVSEPLQPFSESEWERLGRGVQKVVDESFSAYQEARAAAERGSDPRQAGVTIENMCWLLTQFGPLSNQEVDALLGWPSGRVRKLYPGMVRKARSVLFPEAGEAIAYAVLLGIRCGVVPDGIADLGVGDIDWAGDSTVLLDYVKGRTSRESATLGRDAVRLLEQWLEHSSLTRRFAPAQYRPALWVRHNPRYGDNPRWPDGKIKSGTVRSASARWGILGDDGKLLSIHRHRIRTSFESHRDRDSWYGSRRGLIDPNHSAQVEGDRYLTATTPAQRARVDTIVEQAQTDLLRKAVPARILDIEETARFAEQFPDLVAGLGLTDEAISALVGGQQDVFAAACADPLSGLHGPVGKPCPARPWVCLLCPLSLFAPRHVPNLVRMDRFFDRQFLGMTVAHFLAVFGPYAQRVEQVLAAFDAVDPQLVAGARAVVLDTDDGMPLRPEESTQ